MTKDLLEVKEDWYEELKRAFNASPAYVDPNQVKYRGDPTEESNSLCKIPPSLWGLDEAFFSDLICDLPEEKKSKVIFGTFWTYAHRQTGSGREIHPEDISLDHHAARKIDRMNDTPENYIINFEDMSEEEIERKIKEGFFREIHCNRPWTKEKVLSEILGESSVAMNKKRNEIL